MKKADQSKINQIETSDLFEIFNSLLAEFTFDAVP